MNGYREHDGHYDHILVGCPVLCCKEIWDYREVMLIVACAGIIIKGLKEKGVVIK